MVLLLWAAWRPEQRAHQRSVGVALASCSCVVTLVAVIWLAVQRRDGEPRPRSRSTASAGRRRGLPARRRSARSRSSIDYNDARGDRRRPSRTCSCCSRRRGMMMLAAARDLMIVFLGIELMSIAVYVLAGLNRRSARSAEGALKYFLLGAFSTAFLLYGIALVYGATGTHEPRRRSARASRDVAARRQPDAAGRHRAAARRLRVQGRRGAVPHVGARRLRGRADADHGVHGRGGEGGGVRGVPARLARGVPRRVRARGTAPSGGSPRHDGRRQRRSRSRSRTSSACSRTRASRTPATCSSRSRRARRRARRRSCSTCSRTRWRRWARSP